MRSPRSARRDSILSGRARLADPPALPHVTRLAAGEASDALFRRHGIVVRPFPAKELNSLRVSPNLMNTEEDLDRLLKALEVMV